MSRPISLQVYVSAELAARARAAASANGLAVSEWLRGVVMRACDNDLSVASDRSVLVKLYRQSLFAMVGVDALLRRPIPEVRMDGLAQVKVAVVQRLSKSPHGGLRF